MYMYIKPEVFTHLGEVECTQCGRDVKLPLALYTSVIHLPGKFVRKLQV